MRDAILWNHMNPDMGLSFRLATRDDVAATVALLNQTFRTPVDGKTWEWYNYGNLRERAGFISPSTRDDESRRCVSFTRLRVSAFGGSRRRQLRPPSLVSSPAYQGGGSLYRAVGVCAERRSGTRRGTGLGLPNRKSYMPQKVLVRWADFWWMDCLYKLSPTAGATRLRNSGPVRRRLRRVLRPAGARS